MRGVLAALYDDVDRYADRVHAVPGDLVAPALGLSDATREQLATEVDEIVHCGASVSFELPLRESRAINVAGTARVLGLAEACAERGGLRRMTYVSTAYVAGTRTRRRTRGRARRRPGLPQRLRAVQERGRDDGARPPGQAADHDRAAEHRRGRARHGLDVLVQRHLRAAARVRVRRLPGAAGPPHRAHRRRHRRLRGRRDPRPGRSAGGRGRHLPRRLRRRGADPGRDRRARGRALRPADAAADPDGPVPPVRAPAGQAAGEPARPPGTAAQRGLLPVLLARRALRRLPRPRAAGPARASARCR